MDDLRDSDRIEGATDADINAAIVASIMGNGVQNDASIEPFGNYGISGSQSRTGGFEHQILISNDMITNTAGVPQQVTANFIIDGGTFTLNTAPGAMLSYRLTIASATLATTIFASDGLLTGDGLDTVFLATGDDIGAVFNPSTGTVEIPFSFQSVDLGILNPGEATDFLYILDIETDVPNSAENLFFQFSDPVSTQDIPVPVERVNPTFQFSPVVAGVPEPTSAMLFGAGLVGLGFLLRHQRAGG